MPLLHFINKTILILNIRRKRSKLRYICKMPLEQTSRNHIYENFSDLKYHEKILHLTKKDQKHRRNRVFLTYFAFKKDKTSCTKPNLCISVCHVEDLKERLRESMTSSSTRDFLVEVSCVSSVKLLLAAAKQNSYRAEHVDQ